MQTGLLVGISIVKVQVNREQRRQQQVTTQGHMITMFPVYVVKSIIFERQHEISNDVAF